MKSRFLYVPIGSALHSVEVLERLISEKAGVLDSIGGQRADISSVTSTEPLFFFVATGGTESHLMRLWRQRSSAIGPAPLWLIAHPSQNSLPAALEVMAKVQQEGSMGRILYLDGDSALEQVALAASDFRPWQTMRQARLGLVGDPSDWLVASSPSAQVVHNVWGPKVEEIDVEEVLERADAVAAVNAEAMAKELTRGAGRIGEPTAEDIDAVARLTLALRGFVKDRNLMAVAIRCFDLLSARSISGCIALADLNDRGVVAGCEADLPSTVSMLWVRELLDQASWMANPVRLDEKRNILWLAHCTVARSLVESYSLRSHFESGEGVAIEGAFAPGPVTLLRLGGPSLHKIWLAEGELVESDGFCEDLCRTQVQIHLDRGHVNDLLQAPLGNHLVMVTGRHLDTLERWRASMIRAA